MAGESARDLAKRQREKAERLMRSAELYERGADGEEATARALSALPVEEWTVFHDLCWPGRKLANVDHVVVGPGGVFVIDSKNWTGKVEVKDNVLRQNGYQRETSVASAAEAAIAVSLVTPDLPSTFAMPVLCFVRDEPVAGWARDVMVCSTANVAEMLLSRPVVMDAATRQRVALGLDLSLSAARERTRSGSYVALPTSPARPTLPRGPVRQPRPPRVAQPKAAARRRTSKNPRWFLPFVIAVFLVIAMSLPKLAVMGEAVGRLFVDVVAPEPAQPDEPGRKVTKRERSEKERPAR